MADNSNEAQERALARAEMKQKNARAGEEARAQHNADAQATREKTARLRTERLAREATEATAAAEAKAAAAAAKPVRKRRTAKAIPPDGLTSQNDG